VDPDRPLAPTEPAVHKGFGVTCVGLEPAGGKPVQHRLDGLPRGASGGELARKLRAAVLTPGKEPDRDGLDVRLGPDLLA